MATSIALVAAQASPRTTNVPHREVVAYGAPRLVTRAVVHLVRRGVVSGIFWAKIDPPKKAYHLPLAQPQPMTLAEILRKACAANGLGVSGSADQLLARLVRGGKKAQEKKANTSTSMRKSAPCKGGACKPSAKKTQGAIKKAKGAAKKAKGAAKKAKGAAKKSVPCKGGACKPYGKKTQGAIKKAKGAAKKCGAKGAPNRSPYKVTKSGGLRLSAASYFYDRCDGKISRCTPQPIVQPDGSVTVKTIRIVEGAHGKYPRWV